MRAQSSVQQYIDIPPYSQRPLLETTDQSISLLFYIILNKLEKLDVKLPVMAVGQVYVDAILRHHKSLKSSPSSIFYSTNTHFSEYIG